MTKQQELIEVVYLIRDNQKMGIFRRSDRVDIIRAKEVLDRSGKTTWRKSGKMTEKEFIEEKERINKEPKDN